MVGSPGRLLPPCCVFTVAAVPLSAQVSAFACLLFSWLRNDCCVAFKVSGMTSRKMPHKYSSTHSLSYPEGCGSHLPPKTKGSTWWAERPSGSLMNKTVSPPVSPFCSQPRPPFRDAFLVPQWPGPHGQGRDMCQSLPLENGDENAFLPSHLENCPNFLFRFCWSRLGLGLRGSHPTRPLLSDSRRAVFKMPLWRPSCLV